MALVDGFPKGMPATGERVDADASTFIRDLFFENDGRITAAHMDNAIGRMTFTYGQAVVDAWRRLQDDGYAVLEHDTWTWPGYFYGRTA